MLLLLLLLLSYTHNIKCSFGEKAIFEVLFESSSDCVDFMHFTRDHYFILLSSSCVSALFCLLASAFGFIAIWFALLQANRQPFIVVCVCVRAKNNVTLSMYTQDSTLNASSLSFFHLPFMSRKFCCFSCSELVKYIE